MKVSTKSKSYIVERRHEGKLYRVAIGMTSEITSAEVPKKTQTILADISNGVYEKKDELDALLILESIWRFLKIHYSTDENPILKQNPVDVIPAKRRWNKVKPRTRYLDESIHTYYNTRTSDFL